MARRRFQAPAPERRGKWWVLRYWQDEFRGEASIRIRKRVRLAPAEMPEREVKKIAAELLRPLNQGLETIGSATNFAKYVEETYIPLALPTKSKGTRDCYHSVIENYLKPHSVGCACVI